MQLLLLAFIFALGGCGTIRKTAIAIGVGPSLEEASREMEREASWETFRGAVLGNLKVVEGLLLISPHNEDLLAQALKGHSAYAFGVLETLMLDGRSKGKKGKSRRRHWQKLALGHYSKAIYWGTKYLEENDVTSIQLQRSLREGQLSQLLESHFGSDQGIEVIFFLAQSMGAYGNLQKTSPMVVAQLPLVKGLFDWVCAQRPDIRQGACDIFYGAWEVGRPKMLGGDLAKGKKIFVEAITKYPENYLIRTSYLKFYVIPSRDRDIYLAQKNFLRKAFREWRKGFLWPSFKSAQYEDEGNLYRAIAQKQFQLMVKNEKQFF